MGRQAQARLDIKLRHRINAGRVAVRNQIDFFARQFGQVTSAWKEDDTRVTFADFAISEKIFGELRREFSRDDFCSEESSPQDEVLNMKAQFAWVIDPIDGTNNYAMGFSVCAVSLALLLDGEPVYGFIYDHSSQALLEGGPSFGLFKNQKKLSPHAHLEGAQTMLGLHFPMQPQQLDAIKELLAKYRVRSFGSAALTAAYVATGYLTGVIDYKVKVWDFAAAYALCQAVEVEWRFIGESPFPLKSFHPNMNFFPFYAGANSFIDEMGSAITK